MSEALPNVLGDQVAFDNKQQADEVLGLLMRHWNTIASELQRTLREDHVYLPVLLEDSTGVVRGNDWAAGFYGVCKHVRAVGAPFSTAKTKAAACCP